MWWDSKIGQHKERERGSRQTERVHVILIIIPTINCLFLSLSLSPYEKFDQVDFDFLFKTDQKINFLMKSLISVDFNFLLKTDQKINFFVFFSGEPARSVF